MLRQVGFLFLCTSVTNIGDSGICDSRCLINELSPMHTVLPLSISALTLCLPFSKTFRCGLFVFRAKDCA